MANVFKTKLDIKSVRHAFKPVVVQYDHVRLEIELLDGGLPYALPVESRVEFTHVRKDGAVVIHPGEITAINGRRVITYEYQGTEMGELGVVQASFAVFDADDRKVSSHKFEVVVVKDLREETFNPAEPNFGLLQTLIADVRDIKENGGGSGGVGPQGPPGRDGIAGVDGYTPVKGVDYFDGIDGRDGRDGRDGYTPVKGVDYFDGINGQDGIDGKSAYEVAVVNGFSGTEVEWLLSLKGEAGSGEGDGTGRDGINGKSAFEIAVENGFIGTETQWLESLRGPQGVRGLPGEPGYTPRKNIDYFDGVAGQDGTNGIDGKSAYQIAVSNGFSGTEAEWLTSLKGAKGDTGLTGPPGSDANVTSANITTALGYTPIKASDVTWANVLSKPTTYTPSAHTHDWADISNKPTTFSPTSHTHLWSEITGKPTTFTPATHSHSYNDLTNKPNIPSLNNTVTSTSTSEAATANAVKTAYDRANAAFTQASDGKVAIANAVTGKGGTASSSDTFTQLASAITNIPTGKKWASGTFINTKTLTVTNLGFTPSVILMRSGHDPTDTYAISSYIAASLGEEVSDIFNDYNIIVSTQGSTPVPGALSVNSNGFTVRIHETIGYQGIWVAFG